MAENIDFFREPLPDVSEEDKIPIATATRVMLSAMRKVMLTTRQAGENIVKHMGLGCYQPIEGGG